MTDETMSEKTIAEDIAQRIVTTASRAVSELNQATASNATNVIKRHLIALKDLEDECDNDSGLLSEDTQTLAAQTDDITDVATRHFHADIRSWDAYAVQREDAKLSFSKIATYWGKVVAALQSNQPSRRKTAAKSYGVPNYRYKVGQMVKVNGRFGKVVGVSKEGGTGKQVYDVRIDGKDNVRKCGLKEITTINKKKVTKTISVKAEITPEKAKSLLKEYSTAIDTYLPEIEAFMEQIKTHLAKAGMDHIGAACDALDKLCDMWQNEVRKDTYNANPDSYVRDLHMACEVLGIPDVGTASFIDIWNTASDLDDEAVDVYNQQTDLMNDDDSDPRWDITMYKGEATPNDVESCIGEAKKWLNGYNSSAAKSIRSQINPYTPPTVKFQPSVGDYADAGSFDDSYELVDNPSDVGSILESIACAPSYDFLLVKESGGDIGDIWGGEGVYEDDVQVVRLD